MEMRSIDVGVDLGRPDVGMTEQILDDSKVGPALNEMRGEAVPEHVRVDALQSGEAGVLSDDLPDRHSLQRPASTGHQQPVLVTAIGKTSQLWPHLSQIPVGPVASGLPDGNHTSTLSLAMNRHQHGLLVKFIHSDPADF